MTSRMLNALAAPIIPGIIFMIAFFQEETSGAVFFSIIGCLASLSMLNHLRKFPPHITVEEQNSRWKIPPEYKGPTEES